MGGPLACSSPRPLPFQYPCRPSLAEIARSAWLTKNRDPAKDVPAFAADGAAPTAPYQGLHYAGVVTTHPRRHSLSERPSGAHPLACRAPVAPVTPEEPSTSEPEATTSPAAPEGGASERPVSDPYEDEYFHGSVRRTIISQIPGATFFQRSDSSIEVSPGERHACLPALPHAPA